MKLPLAQSPGKLGFFVALSAHMSRYMVNVTNMHNPHACTIILQLLQVLIKKYIKKVHFLKYQNYIRPASHVLFQKQQTTQLN